jgi:hypothetical protein
MFLPIWADYCQFINSSMSTTGCVQILRDENITHAKHYSDKFTLIIINQFFFLFCGKGVWTQGPTLDRQALYASAPSLIISYYNRYYNDSNNNNTLVFPFIFKANQRKCNIYQHKMKWKYIRCKEWKQRLLLFLRWRSCYVVQAGLEIPILLPWPP